MKRIKTVTFILIGISLYWSCSPNDDAADLSTTAVISTTRACLGESPNDCKFSIEYGTLRADGTYEGVTSLETNQATFDYYFEGKRNSLGVITWEGEK